MVNRQAELAAARGRVQSERRHSNTFVMQQPNSKQIALEILSWYQTAGVDAVLCDAPVNWLERGPSPPGTNFDWPLRVNQPVDGTPLLEPAGVQNSNSGMEQTFREQTFRTSEPVRPDLRTRPQTPLAASEAETEARRIARAASSLEALGDALAKFDGCSLKATAKNLCFYRGSAQARLMLIGEAPGRDEDIEGKPFVGRAGQMLDKMLASIGLTETDVHITNIVYWRPPGNRPPTPQETLACRPFLDKQIDLVNPDMIVAVGGSAAKEVFATNDGIMRIRGKWREIETGGKRIAALATLHPAYLLRTPAAKQLAWLDLLAIKQRLTQSS